MFSSKQSGGLVTKRGLLRATLSVAISLAGLSALNAQSAVDLLKLPAPPNINATKSLLLDIERVGTDLYAVGEFGQILSSKDNDGSWTAAKIPVSVMLTALSFADEVHGFAVGHDGVILATDDSGKSWSKLLDGSRINQFVFDAAKERVRQIEKRLNAVPESDQKTRDELSIKLEEAQFQMDTAEGDIDVGPSKPLLDVLALRGGTVFVCGAYGQLLKSIDEGRNWTYLGASIPNPDGFNFNTLMQSTDGRVWVAGEQGRVFVSDDQGETWLNMSVAYDGSIFDLVELPGDGTILALGLRGNLFRLKKGAKSWDSIETDLEETLSSATVLKDGSVVLVGARGILVRSTDGFDTLQVTRRSDKLPSAGVVQLSGSTLLLAGMRGLKRVEIDQFK